MEKEGKRKTTKTICKLILFNNAFMMEQNDISLFGLFVTLKLVDPNLPLYLFIFKVWPTEIVARNLS